MERKKLMLDFGKFLGVGIVWAVFTVFFTSYLIDVVGLSGFLSSSFVMVFAFFGRYFHYLAIKLIHAQFWKYAAANIAFPLLTIAFISLLVDVFSIAGWIASPVVIGTLFLLKFITFQLIGLIRK
jgi:hypothetical protein